MANMLSTEGGTILQVGMTFNTQKAKVQLIRDLDKLEQKSKIQIPVEVDGTRFVKTVRTFEDSMKNLVQVTTMYNGATGRTQDSITGLTSGFERAERAIKEQEQAIRRLDNAQDLLNGTTKKSATVFNDFIATFGKMVKFNTINLIYDSFLNSLSNCVEVTHEFNSAMIEFKKVTDTSNLSLNDYIDTLGKLGETVGFSATEMLQAATEFSKSGYNPETAAQLARISSLYRNIADEELSAGDAASYVISQLKAFGLETDNVTETTKNALNIIDKTNEVSNQFAVSSANIATALTKQSASLATYGNDINEVIGLVTASTEILTNNASKSARGIKTIGANLTNMAQSAKTLDIVVQGATKTIQLWNKEGTDILSTYEILEQIAQYWNDMSDAEKTSLAISQAGKNQIDVYTATMNNFNSAIKAKTTALLADGSAERENEKAMDSLEKKTKAVSAEFENFILSLPIEQIESGVLSLTKSILQLVNSGLVQAIAKITIITALSTSLIALIKWFTVSIPSLAGKIIASITSIAVAQDGLNATLTTTELLLQGIEILFETNPLFLAGTVIASVTALFLIMEKLNVTFEEAEAKLHSLNQAVDESQSNIDGITSKLEEIEKQIKEINSLKLQITDESEIQSLEKQEQALIRQSAELRNQLDIEKAKLQVLKEQQETAAKTALSKTTGGNIYNAPYVGQAGAVQNGENSYSYSGSGEQYAQNLIKGLKATQHEIETTREKLLSLKEGTDEYTSTQRELEEYNREWSEMNAEIADILPYLQDVIDAGADTDGVFQRIFDDYHSIVEAKEEAQNTGNIVSEEDIESLEAEEDAIASFNEQVGEYIGNLQGVQSAYDTMIGAIQEYNENGYYTADTLAKLNSLTSEQLGILSEQGMSIESVTDAMVDQYNVEKEDIVMKLELAKYADLVALSESYLGEQTAGASNAIVVGGNTASANANKYLELAQAAKQAADAMHQVQAALGMDSDAYKNFEADRKKIVEQYDKTIETVRKSQLDLNKAINGGGKKGGGGGSKKGGGGRKGGGSSASKAAKEHEDAWLEAFKNEQKALKHKLELDEITQYEYYQKLKELNEKYFGEISGNHEKYIKEYNENEEEIYKGLKSVYDKVKDYLQKAVEQGYEKAINTLEKEEKAVLSGIKKKIDSLKKEKDSVLDGIQKEIDMLEKQRDETLDGIHKEIDTLKKQKEEVEKYWNDQIDAIKRENEEIEEQNQLLEYQQALQQAKSQKVMVYQDGRFQLTENESAVADAEKALAEYEDQLSYEQQIRQMEDLRDAQIETLEERIEALESYYEYMEEYYEKQIEALEEYKEYMEEYYDSQIEAMEDYYDRVEEQYEKQIDALQSQLDAFKEGCQKAEDLENAKLAATVMAANEEAAVWQQRLENLADAITEYNRLLSLMGEAGVGAESTFSAGTASFTPSSNVSGVNQIIQTRAKGDSSFAKDEIALVGESPNAELVLGSRLNNSVNSGNLVHLSRGSGVVNAESTSTLAGLLNGLSKPTNVANNRSTQQNFTFGNISLPNVTDADSFVNTLSHKFNNYAIQYGNVRK